MVVYSFFSRIVKVVGALNLSKLVCRIQANQTNERNTGTSVKQRKNIFQVRDTLCILSYCVLSQMNWNVFFLSFVSNRIVISSEHDYRWSRLSRFAIKHSNKREQTSHFFCLFYSFVAVVSVEATGSGCCCVSPGCCVCSFVVVVVIVAVAVAATDGSVDSATMSSSSSSAIVRRGFLGADCCTTAASFALAAAADCAPSAAAPSSNRSVAIALVVVVASSSEPRRFRRRRVLLVAASPVAALMLSFASPSPPAAAPPAAPSFCSTFSLFAARSEPG
jgi:hypothetical protein